jgi:hypothetical protein
MKNSFLVIIVTVLLISCKKEGCMDVTANNYDSNAKKDNGTCTYNVIPYEPNLVFIFDFDSTQVRLNNLGQEAPLPVGHAGQSPKFNAMGAHYIELAQSAMTQLGSGEILYHAQETNQGGETAIDFDKSIAVGKGFTFLKIPIKNITPGIYEYLRVSLSYQNYEINFHYDSVHSVPGVGNVHVIKDFPATVASFVGYNSYLTSYLIKNQTITVNENRKQGYWGFETSGIISELNNFQFNYFNTGQAPAGATTVPNPIASTSPIPAGSCVVTGPFFGQKLKITGKETNDIIITISLSTNKSFEWIDGNGNGKWEPNKGEQIVDMGLRGMIPYIQ